MLNVSIHFGIDPDVVKYQWRLEDYLNRAEYMYLVFDKAPDNTPAKTTQERYAELR